MSEPRSVVVRVGDLDFHYVDWGQNGPPLLLMHGGRRNCRSWDAVARLLQPHYWVIALDAKGHGDSAKPSRGYAYPQRMADLQAFLETLGLDSLYAMGHSAGANTMGLHAVAYPGRLRAMVLVEVVIDAAKTLPPDHYRRILRQRRVWESRTALATYLRQHPETRDWRDDVIQTVVEHEVVARPDGSVEMKWSPDVYNLEDHRHDTYNLHTLAACITVPTLLMYSSNSFISRQDITAFCAALPQGQLRLVDDVGHNIYMEVPDLVGQAAYEFFTGVATR